MPLPTGGRMAWPPAALAPVVKDMERWGAWYSGSSDQLAAAYGGATALTPWAGPGAPDRPSTYRGGVVGAVARMFWGQPQPRGEEQPRLHVPIAGDIASMSADLLFGDQPELVAASADDATQARLDLYVERGLISDLRESAEIQAAIGGVYLRVVWDAELADYPWITAHSPETVTPEWRFNRLVAATITTELYRQNTKVVRWLERHESGAIFHGVYEGTENELGRPVPLADYPETEPFALLVNADGAILTNVPRMTMVYIPNVRPNRLWRNIRLAANLGRSDYAGSEQVMDALDETWTSWMRDIRLGKSRLIIPQTALDSMGPGNGAYFDADREIFTGLQLSLQPDQDAITQVQFAIRVADHQATAQSQVEQIVRSAGYSMQTFSGETDGSGVTATEVRAREQRSLTTRDRKIGYWTIALSELLETLLLIDNEIFRAGTTPDAPTIAFPEAVSPDPSNVANTIKLLSDAAAISTETKVRMFHPEWDDDQVMAEVDSITGGALGQAQRVAGVATQLGTASALGSIDQGVAQAMMAQIGGGGAQPGT
jgi:A118 family predicted phage portal protein